MIAHLLLRLWEEGIPAVVQRVAGIVFQIFQGRRVNGNSKIPEFGLTCGRLEL